MSRDSQRTAVYRWGHAVAEKYPDLKTPMSLDDCEALVRRVWSDYRLGETPPVVTDGRGRRHAWGDRHRIKLPIWARTTHVVLHEITHSLLPDMNSHGPAFARLFLELLVRYGDAGAKDVRALGVHQRPRRVRFAPAESVPKPRSREWKAWREELTRLETATLELRRAEPRRVSVES